jgi:hypothetical protein
VGEPFSTSNFAIEQVQEMRRAYLALHGETAKA